MCKQAQKTFTVLQIFVVLIAALSRVTMLWVLPGQVRGHAFGGHNPPYLRLVLANPGVCPRPCLAPALARVVCAPARVIRPVLLDLAVREEAAGDVGPDEQRDRDPGLFHQLYLHPDLVALLPHDPLKPGQELAAISLCSVCKVFKVSPSICCSFTRSTASSSTVSPCLLCSAAISLISVFT